MDIIFHLMVVTLMGLVAIIAGIFEDLESDVASTSNPNSQVQLASEVGNLHKFFNRAISGEPLLVGTMATISGTVCYVLLSSFVRICKPSSSLYTELITAPYSFKYLSWR